MRRGLDNVKIQPYLTATAINLKWLAAALVVRLYALWMACVVWNRCLKTHMPANGKTASGGPKEPEPETNRSEPRFFNSPMIGKLLGHPPYRPRRDTPICHANRCERPRCG